MKTFKRYSAAQKEANGQPIIRIGDVFVVGVKIETGHCVEISIIDGVSGQITGSVTARHLDRLGNANHAEPKRCFARNIWEVR